MKILLIWDYIFDPEGIYYGRHPTQTIELFLQLAKKHDITWIMPGERNRSKNKFFWNEITVFTFSLSTFLFLNVFRKIFKTFQVGLNTDYDVIYIRNSLFNVFLALIIKIFKGSSIVFRITFPSALAKKIESEKRSKAINLFYFFYFLVWNTILLGTSKIMDLIITMSDEMKKYFITLGIPGEKMVSLSAYVNTDIFSPHMDGTIVREKYQLNTCSVILYVGIVDPLRRLDILVRAFKIVKDTESNVKLMIVGNGKDINRLVNLSCELGLSTDVIFTDYIPYLEVPQYIAASDICISPIPENTLFSLSSPSKTLEYMAMGKPVVATYIPDHEKVIQNNQAGVLTKYNNIEMAKAIIFLLQDKEKKRQLGKNGQRYINKSKKIQTGSEKLENYLFNR